MPDEKMKYPLLEFEYDKKLYEELLTLNPHPEFMDNIKPSSEDYMHEDFGFYTDDDKHTLAHAVGVLRQLEKLNQTPDSPSPSWNQDPYSLLEALRTDLHNYCTCVRCCLGSKETLRDLMEAALYYYLYQPVLDEVTACCKESNEGEPPSEDSIFNFDALYIKMGDRILFLENDIKVAMSFYRLPTLIWKVDNSYPSELSAYAHYSRKRSFKNYSVDFDGPYEAYSSIAKGELYQPLNTSALSESYNNILRSRGLLDDPDRLSIFLSAFSASAQDIMHQNPSKKRHQKRIALLMYLSVLQKYLPFELARLRDDPDKRIFQDAALEKARFLVEYPYAILSLYPTYIKLHSTFPKGVYAAATYELFLSQAKTAYLSSRILDELNAEKGMSIKKGDSSIAYYTSADVFSYMLPARCTGSKADRLGKLTVMHLSYMNDPNEGQTLRKALTGTQYGAEKKRRKALNVPYVFVKCFSPRVDYLPMWEMYGDHAKGCCLVINWPATKKRQLDAEPILYRVCYLRKENGCYLASSADNEQLSGRSCDFINEHLQQLQKLVPNLPADTDPRFVDTVRRDFDSLLGRVLYLFKDSSYSYEQELRVIYQTKDNILHTDGDKPWLFVQTPFPLQLDEVILGPKFPDVSTRVPYLQEQLDLMCEKTGTEKPRITLSEIDYR